MNCPHLRNGECAIAHSLCLQSVPATEDACSACCGSANPQQINRVTVSLAINATRNAGKDHSGLVREFAHLFEANKPLPLRALSYAQALLRWNSAGRPVRSEEEVQRLYRDACGPCPLRRRTSQAEVSICGGCGCLLSADPGIDNKLWFASEHCPGPESKF